ncbi:hypothetical protein N9S22_00695 [Paracoccaceae bacterium]|nr:hypothetical protein [Paracoccaceae bacterium]
MNTNMRLITLIFILITPCWAAAQKFQENLKFSDLGGGEVIIDIIDNATNGCWTNIMEAKNYAAGQIDIIGGKVVETTKEAYAVFNISVSAERIQPGLCYGFIDVKVYRPINYDGKVVTAVFSETQQAGANRTNFNNFVLDLIKKAVSEWR